MRFRQGCLAVVLVALAVAVAGWLLRAYILTDLGRALVEDDGAQKAQAIVVLGGDDYGTRIVKAAQLAQAGYAPYVLVSGPLSLLGHESDVTIEYGRR